MSCSGWSSSRHSARSRRSFLSSVRSSRCSRWVCSPVARRWPRSSSSDPCNGAWPSSKTPPASWEPAISRHAHPEKGGDEITALAHSFNQMASELSARAEQVRRSDRMRRQLLADVSHELMTPLTAMRGYSETLTMAGLSLDEATRERYFAIFLQETQRLERIAQDLLDLRASKRAVRRSSRRTSRWRASSVEWRRVMNAPLARRTSRSPRRSRQAPNSCTAIPCGSNRCCRTWPPTHCVTRRPADASIWRRGPATVECSSSPLRTRAKAFPPSTSDPSSIGSTRSIPRAWRRRRQRPGSSIVKATVERHGGRISVESQPGHGSTFRIELPSNADGEGSAPRPVEQTPVVAS